MVADNRINQARQLQVNSPQDSHSRVRFASALNCHPGNYVVADGEVFGKAKGGFACVDLKTGETHWKERVRAGQVCWADGMLYVLADSGGRVSLVDPNADEGARIKGSFSVAGEGSSWAHPVVIGSRMIIRYDTNLYCFDVKAR